MRCPKLLLIFPFNSNNSPDADENNYNTTIELIKITTVVSYTILITCANSYTYRSMR
jgi:hypothetical protein